MTADSTRTGPTRLAKHSQYELSNLQPKICKCIICLPGTLGLCTLGSGFAHPAHPIATPLSMRDGRHALVRIVPVTSVRR